MRDEKYLELLAEKYPTEQAVCREIINLKAILSLPKGTEHFMSDLHGEYEAFCHILNNCSGVIREKVDLLFEDTLSDLDREEICTLIYYPVEKLAMIKKEGKNNEEWYRVILGELIDIARLFSSKYTRSKVRKAMPKEYAYILDELIHVQKDEDDNQLVYHRNILNTLLELQNADEFIEVLAGLIKRLAVDHLHIVGDIFDRGPCADRIMDLLTTYHSIDIEWGNHDILWMGAAAGSRACIATVIRNNLKYDNMKIMENSYGISLRNLTLFAEKIYPQIDPMEAALKAISVLLFKLEGQVILRNPDYKMEDKLLLHKVDVKRQVVEIGGKEYKTIFDVYVVYKNGREEFQEIKYQQELDSDSAKGKRSQKQIGIQKMWCIQNNFQYTLRTDNDIEKGQHFIRNLSVLSAKSRRFHVTSTEADKAIISYLSRLQKTTIGLLSESGRFEPNKTLDYLSDLYYRGIIRFEDICNDCLNNKTEVIFCGS